MALFQSKKKTEKKQEQAVAVVENTQAVSLQSLAHVIKRPRITEKASLNAEKNVYSFEVSQDSNKRMIAAAVTELYNVIPVKVAVAAIPSKKVFVRGKWGVKKGGKKAYVYLKKGDTIEFA